VFGQGFFSGVVSCHHPFEDVTTSIWQPFGDIIKGYALLNKLSHFKHNSIKIWAVQVCKYTRIMVLAEKMRMNVLKVFCTCKLHYVKSSRWCMYSVYDSIYDNHWRPNIGSPDTYAIMHQVTRFSTVYQPGLQAVLFDYQHYPKVLVRYVLWLPCTYYKGQFRNSAQILKTISSLLLSCSLYDIDVTEVDWYFRSCSFTSFQWLNLSILY